MKVICSNVYIQELVDKLRDLGDACGKGAPAKGTMENAAQMIEALDCIQCNWINLARKRGFVGDPESGTPLGIQAHNFLEELTSRKAMSDDQAAMLDKFARLKDIFNEL